MACGWNAGRWRGATWAVAPDGGSIVIVEAGGSATAVGAAGAFGRGLGLRFRGFFPMSVALWCGFRPVGSAVRPSSVEARIEEVRMADPTGAERLAQTGCAVNS